MKKADAGFSVPGHLTSLDLEQHFCVVFNKDCVAFRVMAEELTNARAALQRQTREAQGAIQDLLLEREEFSRNMLLTHRYM